MRKKLLLIPAVICLISMTIMLGAGCKLNITSDTEASSAIPPVIELPVSESASDTEEAALTAADAGASEVPATDADIETEPASGASGEASVAEDGEYTSKDDVALYIHLYGHLPSNFVTKKDAKAAGWEGGSLEDYFPGCSIGGDVFGNREGLLPGKDGRKYYECDIDTRGAKTRGAKRIVFSNDGLVYYTGDHYESFTLLYGEE